MRMLTNTFLTIALFALLNVNKAWNTFFNTVVLLLNIFDKMASIIFVSSGRPRRLTPCVKN